MSWEYALGESAGVMMIHLVEGKLRSGVELDDD